MLRAVGRHLRPLLLVALAVTAAAAIVLAVLPIRYEGTMVLVPVQGQRAPSGLAGAASFLGSTFDIAGTGFDATREVVAYLLRSRTVLLAAAAKPYEGRPLALAIAGREPKVGDEALLLSSLRRKFRVTTSKETGFVTVVARSGDSGAVRVFFRAVVSETQQLFAQVAQSQARELLRAQERRLDTAEAELRRAEDMLLRFDEGNRLLSPRSRLSLARARLERAQTDASRAYDRVVTDRQAAIARELEESPALAVVEDLPVVISPQPRRVVFRALLSGLAVSVAGLLFLVTRELVRSSAALERRDG